MKARFWQVEDAIERFDRLLLDTCILIDEFKRGRNNVEVLEPGVLRLQSIPRSQRSVSILCLWEFLHPGKGHSLSRAEWRERKEWLRDHEIEPTSLHKECSKTFKKLMSSMDECRICSRSAVDGLLAADAKARRWPLVTRNVKDFESIPGLYLVDVQISGGHSQ